MMKILPYLISCHVASLIPGLLAWGFGTAAALRGSFRKASFASFSLCGSALALQLVEIGRLAAKEDASAIYDTIGAVRFCALVLLAVTVALNAAALVRSR